MKFGEVYVQADEAKYAEEMKERQERQFLRRARELGYEVTKIEAVQEAAAPSVEPETAPT
jgi:hypothetical protein